MTPTTIENAGSEISTAPVISNSVALIGLILAIVAALMCSLMFVMANQLPVDAQGFEDYLQHDTPAHLRLLILGCSTLLLVAVALILCVVGLFLPNRPRIMAVIGASISGLILLGVFGVLILGAIMTPQATAEKDLTDASKTATSESESR